jgi:hypothetical protein
MKQKKKKKSYEQATQVRFKQGPHDEAEGASAHGQSRRKWTEAELLKGVAPAICGPDLIPNRAGRELI